MDKKKFNVLWTHFNGKKVEEYDVLPYFRREWKENPYFYDYKNNDKKTLVETKEQLKEWIRRWSKYQFWGRCEYEFLIGHWPFGSYKMRTDLKDAIKNNIDLDTIDGSIKMDNIITQDMEKIDIDRQIMMNIDIITDILYEEFLNKKEE